MRPVAVWSVCDAYSAHPVFYGTGGIIVTIKHSVLKLVIDRVIVEFSHKNYKQIFVPVLVGKTKNGNHTVDT